MSQDFTDNVYDSSYDVLTTMENVEKNFAALKSSFSGGSAPSNTIEGLMWLDTTNHILKIRNETDSAWLNIWNMASNKPYISNLSAEITLAMMAASAADAAAATASLRTLGTGAAQACAGNDSRLSDTRTPTDGTVSQAKLKTSIVGSVSISVTNGNTGLTGVLPGGEYGFRCKYYGPNASTNWTFNGYAGQQATSYTSPMLSFTNFTGNTETFYGQERYVTSSGEVHWIFSLRNRETGLIEKSWQCSDHCCFGNGDDPAAFPHPYGDYDQDKYELIVINPPKDFVNALHKKAGKFKDVLQIISEEYVIDDLSSPAWPVEKVTVGLPGKWEEIWKTGQPVKSLKASIPKPKQAITRVLKQK